jgi:hypothetical protein
LTTRTVQAVCVGKVENGFLEGLNLAVHLMRLNMGLEHGEIVDCTLPMGCTDDILAVLSDVFGNFAPSCLDGCDRVG